MSRESFFQGALSNFIFDFACGGAIRHLADQGYTSAEIVERLSYPASYERVREAVTEHFLEKGVLLRQEPVRGGVRERYVYVQEHGSYGRTSFRRVPVTEDGAALRSGSEVPWREIKADCAELAARLRGPGRQALGKEAGKESDRIYVACAFCATGKDSDGYAALSERQQDYLRGICWDTQPMYHLLNERMREIVLRLCDGGFWWGKVYFEVTREILMTEKSEEFSDGSV